MKRVSGGCNRQVATVGCNRHVTTMKRVSGGYNRQVATVSEKVVTDGLQL